MQIPGFRFLLSPELRAYVRCLVAQLGGRVGFAVGLLIVVSLLEGWGLLLILPLLGSLGIAHGGAAIASPLALIRAGSSPHAFSTTLAILVAIKAAQSSLRGWSGHVNLRLENDFTNFLRERFYRDLIAANWLVVTRQRASDLSHVLLDELPRVGTGTQQLLAFLGLLAVALVQVIVAFVLSPGMTFLALGAGGILFFGLRRLRRRSMQLARTGQSQRAEMAAAVHEHLAGIKLAKSHAREHQHFDRFRTAMHAISDHLFQRNRVGSVTRLWIEIGSTAALAGFLYFAVEFRHLPSGQLILLGFIFTRLLAHANQLQTTWQHTVELIPSFSTAETLRQELVAAAEPPAPAESRRLVLRHALRLENVSFRYDPTRATAALSDLTLDLPARRVTALCGLSGAGKSTLADLALGLLPTTAGRITIDGAPLAGDTLHAWRRSIGYVPQETFLFHETVRANLLWAEPAAAEAALRTALRAAAAEDFVDRLPHGLDTLLGDRGVRLSGGERQRLALARALLRRPTFLVLDEATSSLDSVNERLVQDAIERLQGELTLLVIAHRLTTVRFADHIVVLEAGRVVERGTWAELNARDDGAFRRLVLAGTA